MQSAHSAVITLNYNLRQQVSDIMLFVDSYLLKYLLTDRLFLSGTVSQIKWFVLKLLIALKTV